MALTAAVMDDVTGGAIDRTVALCEAARDSRLRESVPEVTVCGDVIYGEHPMPEDAYARLENFVENFDDIIGTVIGNDYSPLFSD